MSDPNYIDPAPADPVPGQVGHLDHHIWLKESAIALDSEVKTLSDALEGAGAWASYTPAWTGAGGNPALGNGTVQAAYKRIGSTVHFRIWVTCGSTTTYGSGAWSFALPTASKASSIHIVRALLIDGATTYYPSYGIVSAASSTVELMVSTASGSYVSGGAANATTPFTMASTDQIIIQGTYEAA